MVAKINVGSSLFGALAYNQNKIDEGEGKILCSNKMTENLEGRFDIHSCMRDFDRQLPKDIKTEKPILHISLNPHPDDVLSDDQLTAIAQKYMERMGYGNQPYMVYKHEDIERHHLHIVSLNVDENGKKIADGNNFYRSKKITREIEQEYGLHNAEKKKQAEAFNFKKVDANRGNLKSQIANVIKPLVARYQFMSFGEYKTLLSLYNVNVEEVVGKVNGRDFQGLVYQATNDKGEKVGIPLKSSLFGKSLGYKAIQDKYDKSKTKIKNKHLKEQSRKRILSVLDISKSKATFETELAKRGIDVVFRENDAGRIYGVTFIDHENACIYNGSRLGKDLSANSFETRFNHEITARGNNNPRESISSDCNNYTEDNSVGGLFNLLSMETLGNDPDEERFRRLIQRKKKKKLRRKL